MEIKIDKTDLDLKNKTKNQHPKKDGFILGNSNAIISRLEG